MAQGMRGGVLRALPVEESAEPFFWCHVPESNVRASKGKNGEDLQLPDGWSSGTIFAGASNWIFVSDQTAQQAAPAAAALLLIRRRGEQQ
jgi:hypothetical protein